ncbi:hypothetical protein TcWFU_001060 [Taenia crassiceps]|uniref:CCDC66 domain-containing protein n=1 Tax=Taenia crassiceps TaxID=6207 RepID=A0ABR4QP37_9CEST
MSSRSSKVRATIEARSRQERFKTKKDKKANQSTATNVETGRISKQKLSAVLGNDKQVGDVSPKSQKVDSLESIREAVQRLIELNKDKLSDSQLVDLIASFYLVTNQCLKKCKTGSMAQVTQGPVEVNQSVTEERKQDSLSQSTDAIIEEAKKSTSNERPISLLEKKRLQWLQERAMVFEIHSISRIVTELELLESDRAKSVMDLSAETDIIGGKMQTTAARPVLSAKNYHRVQRCHYLSGLPVGEDPRTEADLKEQQRRQWLAELDRQVEERRVARERERLQLLSVKTADDIMGASCAVGAESKSSAAKCDVKSVSFGRGRGLADLLGKQDTDSAARRQQQLELQVAYAEQIRERTERRRREREEEARMEAEEAARLEADCARLRREQEAESARRRENEATKHAVVVEAQERASREAKVPESEMTYKKRTRGNVQRPSCNTDHIPRSSNRTPSHQRGTADGGERMTKPKFGSTYTLSNRDHVVDGDLQNKQYAPRRLPVVNTESTLPAVASNTDIITTATHPTSDFFSAITDPDFAYPQASRDSALQQVSRIKENLARRRHELRSMQNF